MLNQQFGLDHAFQVPADGSRRGMIERLGAFVSASPPTLAPIESSAAFLAAYQDFRERRFTAQEQEIAWAASLWAAAHNARWERVRLRLAEERARVLTWIESLQRNLTAIRETST